MPRAKKATSTRPEPGDHIKGSVPASVTKLSEDPPDPKRAQPVCPNCRSTETRRRPGYRMVVSTDYHLPLWTCGKCGTEFGNRSPE